MATNTALVQQLYVAYFNRPADVDSLKYYTDILAASSNTTLTIAQISADFANAAEYKDAFAGQTAKQIINTVYHNLFGHEADIAGLNYWADLYAAGKVTLATVVSEVANGALGSDEVAFNNKVTAATKFTDTISLSADEQLAYANSATALATVKAYLAGVTDDASLATAITNVDIVASSLIGTVTTALTVGADSLVGSSGSDVFNALPVNVTTGAAASTLTAFDSIDGGAGNDTLNIYANGDADATKVFNGSLATSATVKNVETINIINTGTVAFYTGTTVGTIDASKFIGATTISQATLAADLTNLADTTTAVYRSIDANVNIAVADAAKSATIVLDNFTDEHYITVGATATKGALAAVNVSGTVVDADDDGAAPIGLKITVGKDVQAVTVNTSVNTFLDVSSNTTGTKVVTSVDASASTGAISYDAGSAVATVKTGAGADEVSLNTVFSSTVKTASISTGAGNDQLVVDIDNSAAVTGTVSVDAGDGDDKINVTIAAGVAYTVLAGAGNDVVTIDAGTVKSTDKIDGGAGTDTIVLTNNASLVADDYIVYNKVLLNFETLQLTSQVDNLDGSQLATAYTTLDLADGSTATKITATQAVVANGDLTATATGYSITGAGVVTYAGTLNLTEKVTGDVLARASTLNLSIVGGSDDGVAATDVTLTGDAKTATITLAAGTDTTDDSSVASSVTIAVGTATDAFKGLTTLTLKGNGAAIVTNTGATNLVTVDSSALTNTDADGALSGHALTYTSTNTKAETITLGAGADVVTLSSSLYGGPDAAHTFDTVSGLHLVLNTAGTALTATSDQLHITGSAGTIETFTTTQTDIDLALKDAAAYAVTKSVSDVVFQVGGNTYYLHDAGTVGSIDAADTVVKLVGTIDLAALKVALAVA